MELQKIRDGVDRVVQGAWVDNIPFAEVKGLALRVRGLYNQDAERIREEMVAKLPEDRRQKIEGDDADAILTAVLAYAAVQDWNLTEGGEPIPYTPERAVEMFSDPQIGKVLKAAALYAAQNVAERGRASLEADEKN